MRSLATLFLAAATLSAAPLPDIGRTVQTIGQRCQAAKEYTFEGDLLLAGQRGTAPGRTLSHAKVKLAAAPAGKYYLRIEPEGKDAYVLVSNGQKSWAFVPKLKQYTEEESATRDEPDNEEDGGSDTERDLAETFARLILPTLARLHTTVQAADFSGEAAVKYGKKKGSWPLLRVAGKPDKSGNRSLTQLAIDPEALTIGRMVHSTVTYDKEAKTVVQLSVDFTSFELGPVPEATFTFEPPKGAKLVDAVPIPGQTGSFLLNQPAPDFELKTLDGEKVKLSELRGRPVMLNFWASWCPPCRRELPEMAKLHAQYKDKGLVILGVNDEGKATARKYSDQVELPFPTLDDSGLKAHRLYRVHSIPTVFVIGKDGKVVRFLRGARDPATMRAALASIGL